MVRDKTKAELVAAHGIEPVVGLLDDAVVLHAEAQAADAVVNAASNDHRGAVEVLIAAMLRIRRYQNKLCCDAEFGKRR